MSASSTAPDFEADPEAGAGPAASISRPGFVYSLGRAVLRPWFWLLYRPKRSGMAQVPRDGAVLLASNHLSAWDTVLIPTASPRPVQFLTKSSYFTGRGLKGAFLRWFFTSIGAVPVIRSAGRSAQGALETGSAVLRAGSVFAVFPEGTRSRDGRLYRGRSGAAWMALETGASVVPVGLIGTDQVRPFGYLRRGRSRPEVRFGAPLDFSALAGLPAGRARAQATEQIMDAIAALTGQERADEVNAGSRD